MNGNRAIQWTVKLNNGKSFKLSTYDNIYVSMYLYCDINNQNIQKHAVYYDDHKYIIRKGEIYNVYDSSENKIVGKLEKSYMKEYKELPDLYVIGVIYKNDSTHDLINTLNYCKKTTKTYVSMPSSLLIYNDNNYQYITGSLGGGAGNGNLRVCRNDLQRKSVSDQAVVLGIPTDSNINDSTEKSNVDTSLKNIKKTILENSETLNNFFFSAKIPESEDDLLKLGLATFGGRSDATRVVDYCQKEFKKFFTNMNLLRKVHFVYLVDEFHKIGTQFIGDYIENKDFSKKNKVKCYTPKDFKEKILKKNKLSNTEITNNTITLIKK